MMCKLVECIICEIELETAMNAFDKSLGGSDA